MCAKNPRSSKRGHRAQIYRVPTHLELASILGVEPINYQKMTQRKLAKATYYRAEVYAASQRCDTGQYSPKELARPLGISRGTTVRHDKRVELEVIPNLRRIPLTDTNIEDLPRTKQALRVIQNQPSTSGKTWIEAQRTDGEKKQFAACQDDAARAFIFAGRDGKVDWVTQLANTYRPGK